MILKNGFARTLLATGLLCLASMAQTPTSATLYTAGWDLIPNGTALGSPVGGFHDGTYFWVADRASDLSRLTPVPQLNLLPKTGIDFLTNAATTQLGAGLLQSNLVLTNLGGLSGQPAFDRITGIGYAPAARSGRGGPGLVRFQIVNNLGVNIISIATTAGLSGRKMSAAALGPDGHLYLGFESTGDIVRVLNPSVGTTQTVQTIGRDLNGRNVTGLAFLGNDLYITQRDGFTRITNAPACVSGCQAVAVPGSTLKQNYWAVAADPLNNRLYVAQDSNVLVYDVVAQTQTLVVDRGTYPDGSVNLFKFSGTGAGLTLDTNRTLWIGDNTGGGLNFQGRVWTLAVP